VLKFKWIVGLVCLTASVPALAYIGPGAGISFIGSLFSTFMVVLLALSAILLWPLRYAWRRAKRLVRESKAETVLEEEVAADAPDVIQSRLAEESTSIQS
jgi:hypothetical protein